MQTARGRPASRSSRSTTRARPRAADFVETVQGTFGTAAAADTIIVVKRSRGEADATLYVTGRDVDEQELALRFAPETGTWELLGDAAEYGLGETRKEILDAIRAHGSLTPKQASDLRASPTRPRRKRCSGCSKTAN